MTAIAVTIAGSDSGGGAGIQADLKTFSALGVYGASVITALTAQNTCGVSAIHDVPADFIRAQIDAVFSDLDVAAVKIGMLSQAQTIDAVADGLTARKSAPVVLDPVMVAASGDPLIADDAVQAIVDRLFPLAALITPNLSEAARLLGRDEARTRDDMETQARALLGLGARAVLLKGGHFEDSNADDVLVWAEETAWFSAPRHDTKNTHGTGCTLSSAIASGLARGLAMPVAVDQAKAYLTAALVAADDLRIGQGNGPVHHFHAFWEKG